MREQSDMPLDEFERAAQRAIGWIVHYLGNPEGYPVLSRAEPGELKRAMPEQTPETGEPIGSILDDFEHLILPGITHWNHPGFFAYFGITGSGPGILGELLSAALNVNAMLWKTSPAATELEEVALDWLRRLVGLPEAFEGVIMDTASVATLCAIAAARHAIPELDVRQRGLAGRAEVPRLRLYTSEQAHSSVAKAAIALGLGLENVVMIPADAEYRMRPDALTTALESDRSAGHLPFCVVATVGTTGTTSVDPVPELADICGREGVWLHVDAAYAGAAAVVPEYRYVLDGCELADSLVLNPHKWLFTPIDCSAFYARRPEVLTGAFSLVPEYLRTDIEGDVRNYMDWGIALGRRFRALKLWMVLRYFGAAGIRERLAEHIRLGQLFAGWVDEHPDFERLAPTPFSVVCFRARPGPDENGEDAAGPYSADAGELDRLNEKLLERLNATGEIYLSHTRLHDRFALRLAVGNIRTDEAHVARAWELVRRETARLLEEGVA